MLTPAMSPDPSQVIEHGGRAKGLVTAETTQLVVLPQPAGASVTAAALLEAVARGSRDDHLAVDCLRSRLASGQLHIVSATCACDLIPQPTNPSGSGRDAACHLQQLGFLVHG